MPVRNSPPKFIYLTKLTHISPKRTAVSQEIAGITPQEAASFLSKRGFKSDDIGELLAGWPLEASDNIQYRIDFSVIKEARPVTSQPKRAITPTQTEEVMASPKPEWGKKVREHRERAGLSQEELSKRMGFSSNTISPIENNKRKFKAQERKLFFEIIKLPEDTSIPVMTDAEAERSDRALSRRKRSAPKRKTARPKKAAGTQAKKAEEAASEPLPAKPAEPKAHAASSKPPKSRTSRGESVSTETSISATKEAICDDIASTIRSPKLADAQAVRLHSLFKSLVVNVILE
jgi:transcriptional regulator with XRE-family HTH domain